MTLYSPVVFTDDKVVEADALARGWHVVSHVNDNVLKVTGNAVLCGLPQPRFSIPGGSLDASSTPVWSYVLNWLALHLYRPMIIVAPDDPLAGLAQWAASTRGLPFGALLTRAPDGDARTAEFLLDAHGGYAPLGPAGLCAGSGLPESPAAGLLSCEYPARVQERRVDGSVTRVLVVFHGPPTDARVEAWRAVDDDLTLTVDVVTPSRHGERPPATHVVPDHGAANVSDEEVPTSPSAQWLFADESATFTTDWPGGYWAYALDAYFDERGDRFDVVVLIGAQVFEFAASAKRRWYARTVLCDLPPLPMSDEVEYRMRGWCFAADAIVAPPVPSFGGGQDFAVFTDEGPEARRDLVTRLADHGQG